MTTPESDGSVGCVLILSNTYGEESPLLHEQHSEEMTKLWIGKLGCKLFERKVHSALTAEDVMKLFERLATKKGSQYQYLVVVVIGKGGLLKTSDGSLQPFIKTEDEYYVQEEALFSKLYNNNKAWCEKPKLFVLGYDRMNEPTNSGDKLQKQFPWRTEKKSSSDDGNRTTKTCSKFSGRLVAYGDATNLVPKIYDVFSTRHTKDTFTQMLTRVNREMKKLGLWSVFESTITSSCTLFPPRDQDVRNDSDNNSCNINDDVDRSIKTLTENLRRSSEKKKSIEFVTEFFATFDRNSRIGDVLDAISQLPRSRKSMKTPVKGCGVVISNILKKGTKYHETDEEEMKGLWGDKLGCDIKTHLNKTAIDMKKILKKMAGSDSNGYDYLVVVVSSHGGLKKLDESYNISKDDDDILRSVFFGVDKEPVCEREILSYFKGEESPWHDVVKIFIFDYCRGEKKDMTVTKNPDPFYSEFQFRSDEKVFSPDTLPLMNKCVVVYGAYYDHVAWSNYLIPTLAEIFRNNWKEKSVTEMLVMVNARMRDMKPRINTKAMSIFKSTLDDEFYLYKEEEINNEDI